MGSNEIKSGKILVGKIFSELWFRIPEYQRPYVWGADEINDLLGDISYAMSEKPDSEYFLGSFVYQTNRANPAERRKFDENDLLDGQQRMTTLLLLFSVIRDKVSEQKAKDACKKRIFQEENKYERISGRSRIFFYVRKDAQNFIDDIVKKDGATQEDKLLAPYKKLGNDYSTSAKNMAQAIGHINKFFDDNKKVNPKDLLYFLLNNVLLIYIATENLDDAFRLFTILNARGIPLRNSDILKSINLGALTPEDDKKKYAKLWEEAESEFGEDFDRFLNYIRTVLVKEKARLNLLQEFEDKIYKTKEKRAGNEKVALLDKGKETFKMVGKYLKIYQQLFDEENNEWANNYEFDNLLKVMNTGLPSSDWIPPLLRYYEKFGTKRLYEFLKALDNKFSADWITRETPTTRIEAMNSIIKEIDKVDEDKADDVISSNCLKINDEEMEELKDTLEGKIYGNRFARYILLKLDHLYQDHDNPMNFATLSVEHILPQNPKETSDWVKDFAEEKIEKIFAEEKIEEIRDKLGNLVLIARRKNIQLGRLDYTEKRARYFEGRIGAFPNSLNVLTKNDVWTPVELKNNHDKKIEKLMERYGAGKAVV